METPRRSDAPSDGSAAAGSQPAPVPAEQRKRFRYSELRKRTQFSEQQLISAVEELDAAMDNDVTCAVSILHEPAAVCFKMQEAVVETDLNSQVSGMMVSN